MGSPIMAYGIQWLITSPITGMAIEIPSLNTTSMRKDEERVVPPIFHCSPFSETNRRVLEYTYPVPEPVVTLSEDA